jgi:predicted NUDIX family NTP pyrophosphohydrolase
LDAPLRPLTPRPTYRGKVILPWLAQADLDLSQFKSQAFELEWPPRSGRFQDVPEVDKAAYFSLPVALEKVLPAQAPILLEAADLLAGDGAQATGLD